MSVELEADPCSGLSIPMELEIEGSYLEEAERASLFSCKFFEGLAEFFRDRFYLPLNVEPLEQFFIDSGSFAAQFVEMLKGNNTHFDPTFPFMEALSEEFVIRDVPVVVQLESKSYTFQTRIIESIEETEGGKAEAGSIWVL